MAVRVGASTQSGVPGGRLGVGVVVVAVGKPRALVHEEVEAAAFEFAAIAIEIVAAKLVNHHDHDQLGLAGVHLGRSGDRQEDRNEEGQARRKDRKARAQESASCTEHISHHNGRMVTILL